MALLNRIFSIKPRAAMSLCQKALMSSDGYQSPLPWNYIWKPGPYPRTQEERDAAARKYGLIPEDYKPFPEDQDMGDYPDLEPSAQDSRSGFEMWDIPNDRRNFCEPPRSNYFFTIDTGIDDTTRKHESDYRIFCKMILAYGSMFGFLILGMNFPTFLEVTPEIRPYDPAAPDFYAFRKP